MYVYMYGHHLEQSMNQPRNVANPAINIISGELNREKCKVVVVFGEVWEVVPNLSTKVSGTGTEVVPNLSTKVSGTSTDVVPSLPKFRVWSGCLYPYPTP